MIHHVTFPGLGFEFDLNTIAFSIGNFSVYWYGIIIAVGFLLAMLYAIKMSKPMKINSDHVFDACFIGLIAGVIGARLYYVVFYPGDKYLVNPMEIFSIKDGGLGIYGGIIFGLIAAIFVAKWRKMSVGAIMDLGCIGFLIGQGIGRWGNFVNQEAFGDNTTLPWGMYSQATNNYMQNLAGQNPYIDPSMPVHPCFFYESMLCLLGFVVLHYFTKNFRRYDGQTALLYAIWYGVTRFFIEGIRTDSLMVPGINMKVSQVVALLSVAAAIAVLVILKDRTKLTGCGDKAIMELNTIVLEEEVAMPEVSTIFGDDEIEDDTDEEDDEKDHELTEDENKNIIVEQVLATKNDDDIIENDDDFEEVDTEE